MISVVEESSLHFLRTILMCHLFACLIVQICFRLVFVSPLSTLSPLLFVSLSSGKFCTPTRFARGEREPLDGLFHGLTMKTSQ